MSLIDDHAVRISGDGPVTVLLGHGIGGNQQQWMPVAEGLRGCRVVTFAVTGSVDADPGLFSPTRHSSVTGFADDLRDLTDALGIRGCVYVGHSMSAMAGVLATVGDPGLFSRLVLINGSACYVNDPERGYHGGFSTTQIDEMLRAMEVEYVGWSAGFGRHVTANDDRPELGLEFSRSLMAMDPDLATVAFRAAFTGDFRRYVHRVEVPSLILQSRDDPAVPQATAGWLAEQMPAARLHMLTSSGHHPHLADPAELVAAMQGFITEAG